MRAYQLVIFNSVLVNLKIIVFVFCFKSDVKCLSYIVMLRSSLIYSLIFPSSNFNAKVFTYPKMTFVIIKLFSCFFVYKYANIKNMCFDFDDSHVQFYLITFYV